MLQCLELIRMAEKNVGTDEEMDEMSVGITYEILDIAVCMDLDMVEHIPKDISQSHAA